MKNKKLLYVLIPFTLLIWGMIIYRIFNVVNPTSDFKILDTHQNSKVEEKMTDTFSISANYRDPFLGKIQEKVKPTITQNSTNNVKQKVKKAEEIKVKPNMIYLGLIKSQKNNKQVALVQINGTINNMIIGDKYNGVEITKIYRDSIEIKFGNEKFYLRK